ncbi:MAG: tRNA epoxyqueuosine(34) reductase QueG [Pseudomonadota bacterium]
MSDAIKKSITEQAKAIGFDAVGFYVADLPLEISTNLYNFLENNHHGDMGWMLEKAPYRSSPKALWAEARSVIMLGHNYAPDSNPMEKLEQKTIGNISCYALNEDYHDVIKKRLKKLAGWVAQEYSCDVKVFVDTAPIMEKPLAERAGLGWQGKHTCLVSREFGSWLFLGAIFTTLKIEPDNSAADNCGSCTKCLDICPTNAFTAAGKIDARKCISYLTIEHKGQIPLEFRKAIGNRIYGCDDCLAICPWNKFAKTANETAYHPRAELQSPLLKDLVVLDDAAFRSLFRKSPVKRIGRDRFVRNVLIAIGNSGDASLLPTINPLKNDESPLVAEMAEWAIDELEKSML